MNGKQINILPRYRQQGPANKHTTAAHKERRIRNTELASKLSPFFFANGILVLSSLPTLALLQQPSLEWPWIFSSGEVTTYPGVLTRVRQSLASTCSLARKTSKVVAENFFAPETKSLGDCFGDHYSHTCTLHVCIAIHAFSLANSNGTTTNVTLCACDNMVCLVVQDNGI